MANGDKYDGKDRRVNQSGICAYGDKVEVRMMAALENLGTGIGEFKDDMKDTVKELKDDMKEITKEVFKRLPLWATFVMSAAGTVIGVLATMLAKKMGGP